MPGILKRKYNSETMRLSKEFTGILDKIIPTLPENYDKNNLLESYIKFYPKHWQMLQSRYNHYTQKDKFLSDIGKKARYHHKTPHSFFYSLSKVKLILSDGFKKKHKEHFDQKLRENAINTLLNKVKPNQVNKSKLQIVDPAFLEFFIFSYHQKRSTLERKIEIINELKKYKTDNIITFFQKLNDAEHNNSIRDIAFSYLQSISAYVRKRKNFKGKIKEYQISKFHFNGTPESLVEEIKENNLQAFKTYDVFISHSYKDNTLVTKLKNELNRYGLHIYCDWTSDNDFLKRDLASDFTKQVLKYRLECSDIILFLQTENSINQDLKFPSEWVQMEIEHANFLQKKIICLNLTNVTPISETICYSINDEFEFSIQPDEIKKLCITKT